jgi:5-methylcytosine-specific restriction endonuclease McrA
MGKWIHRLTDVNITEKTGVCSNCGPTRIRVVGSSKKVIRCRKAVNFEEGLRRRPYSIHKQSQCNYCGFVAMHPVQLDVDHIDGDNTNNSLENLQTLCANCHRLKTLDNKDWENKSLPSL